MRSNRRRIFATSIWATLVLMPLLQGPIPPARGQAGEASVAGEIETRSSFEHIGIRWSIEGDGDLDGQVQLRYRPLGEPDWQTGMPLLRSHPGLSGEGGDRPDNRWAGSIFWLAPGADYEIELRLVDPDGGSETRVVTASTRRPMEPAADARQRFVVPGEGGGSGSLDDPFRGLQAAADAAQPGDLFLVESGRYAPWQLLASGEPGRPIVFRGPEDRSAVVDGAGVDRGIVTLGHHDRTIGQVMVERMTIRDGRWGVDAQHSRDITLRHLQVEDVDDGVTNRRGDAAEGDQTVCDSVFRGRVAWPGEGIPSQRAIDLRGDGNVVCFNRISGFGDGVSLQPSTGPSWGNDAYGNDIHEIVDDPIEIDYNQANARVWANRVTNGRMGISLAPVYGGPAYVFRNVFFNLESSAYKMNRQPAGLVILHNTSLKRGNGTSSPAGWQNTLLRNNYLFGTRYIFEEYGLVPGSVDDWDYDALAREPACGGDTPPCFKWDDVRYDRLSDFAAATGQERHGLEARRDQLRGAPLPEAYETRVAPESVDLRPAEASRLIDRGAVLTNINAPWVRDGRPDIGAYEAGSPSPHYGPRPIGAPLTFLDPERPVPSVTATVPPSATATAEATPTADVSPTSIATGGPTSGSPTSTSRAIHLPWLAR